MEGYEQTIMDSPELRPELWETLPNDLKDIIIDKMLGDLPFSRVLSFCFVCRRWTAFLLNTQYLLYSHNDQYQVFNSRMGLWESVALQFCQEEGHSLQRLQQACSTGDLLLSTNIDGEFIVFNPLTKLYRIVRRLGDNIALTRLPAPARVHGGVTQLTQLAIPTIRRFWFATITLPSDTGSSFDIFYRRYLKFEGTIFVNDSRSASWLPIVDVPRDFAVFADGPIMRCKEGKIVVGFGTCSGGSKFLSYDADLRKWEWVHYLPRTTELSTEDALAIVFNGEGELEFREIQNTGLTLTSVAPAFPTPTILKLRECKIDILHVEDGCSVYKIVVVRSSQSETARICVRTSNRADRSDYISNWKVWWPLLLGRFDKNLANRFQIFRPSLLPP